MNQLIVFFTLLFQLITIAVFAEQTCVAGEVLVKITGAAQEQQQSFSEFEDAHVTTQLGTLDSLFAKYNVTAFDRLLPGSADSTANARYGFDRIYLLKMPDSLDAASVAADIDSNEWIESAYPNYYGKPTDELVRGADYNYSNQWAFNGDGTNDIDIERGWTYCTTGSSDVTVAVLDDGLDMTYTTDLSGRIVTVPGCDVADGDDDPSEFSGQTHGEAVAGIIAANGGNSYAITGVA